MCCRVFSTHLKALCKLHPPLIVEQYRELLEFTSTTTNIYSKEDFYTHVVREKRITVMCVFIIYNVHYRFVRSNKCAYVVGVGDRGVFVTFL